MPPRRRRRKKKEEEETEESDDELVRLRSTWRLALMQCCRAKGFATEELFLALLHRRYFLSAPLITSRCIHHGHSATKIHMTCNHAFGHGSNVRRHRRCSLPVGVETLPPPAS